MSKVIRLGDDVLENLDKVSDYLKSTLFQDDLVSWHLAFDRADENTFIRYVLTDFLMQHDIK